MTIHFHSGGEEWYVNTRVCENVSCREKTSAEKTPLKSTQFIPNDYCKICRINLKISGRSKINIFGSKRDNEEFLKTLSLILLSEINSTQTPPTLSFPAERGEGHF